jgi:hypothetical protein
MLAAMRRASSRVSSRLSPSRPLVQHGRGQGGLPFKPLKETSKQIILTCRTVQMYRIGVGNKPSGRRSLIDESTGSCGNGGTRRYKHYPYKD